MHTAPKALVHEEIAPAIKETVVEHLPSGPASVRANFGQFRSWKIITPDNASSPTANEFRAIKRKLLPMTREAESDANTLNRIMITSALPDEGKTFVAVNLAMSLSSERNLQVLLIDADVVRPSVPQFFTGATESGLTDLLTGRCSSIRDIVRPCADVPNLSVIFSGKHEDNSPELFASDKMEKLCQELSAENPNRILIFDAPPALAAAEPTALAIHMHHVLMVAAADQPSRTEIEEAISRVSACPRMQLIFNKSPLWRQTANSKYSYYYRKDATAD